MITVPCCRKCNQEYGREDEIIRNIFSSLVDTEQHPAIIEQIGPKRDRSLRRPEGKALLDQYLKSIQHVGVKTPSGIYLGESLAFDSDQDVMDRFFERMTRGLVYHVTRIAYTHYSIRWRLFSVAEFVEWPDLFKQIIGGGITGTIGDVFRYLAVVFPEKVPPLLILEFFKDLGILIKIDE